MEKKPAEPTKTGQDAAEPRRAPYRKPQLVRYGTVADITRAVGASGLMDGSAVAPNRTRP